MVQDRAPLLPLDPEQDLALGNAGRSREVIAMQGATAVAVRGARKEGMSACLGEHVLRRAPALRRPHALDGEGWETLLVEQALMGGRLIELADGLRALCQVARGAGSRHLIVLEAPLHMQMRLDPVQLAFSLGPDQRLMVDLEPSTDGFKRVRRRGPAALRPKAGRGAIAEARRIEDHQRRPRGVGGGPGPREHGAGRAVEEATAPPRDPVEGNVPRAAIEAPVLMAVRRLVGMGLGGRLAPARRPMGDVIVHEVVQRPNTTDGPRRAVRLGQQTPAPNRARGGMGFLQMIPLPHPWQPDFARRLLGPAFVVEEPSKVLRLKPGPPRIHGRSGHVHKATEAEFVPAWIVEFHHLEPRRRAIGIGMVGP